MPSNSKEARSAGGRQLSDFFCGTPADCNLASFPLSRLPREIDGISRIAGEFLPSGFRETPTVSERMANEKWSTGYTAGQEYTVSVKGKSSAFWLKARKASRVFDANSDRKQNTPGVWYEVWHHLECANPEISTHQRLLLCRFPRPRDCQPSPHSREWLIQLK